MGRMGEGEGGGVEEVGGLAGHHLPRLPSCSQAQVRLRLRKLWLQLGSRLAMVGVKIMIIIMIVILIIMIMIMMINLLLRFLADPHHAAKSRRGLL